MTKHVMTDIRILSKQEINILLTEAGYPAFRTKQIWYWMWKAFVSSFDDMKNIPLELRAFLKEKFNLTYFNTIKITESLDNTTKLLIEFGDKSQIEAVLIPDKSRMTACLSTQVGCPGACTFCATAKLGFKRNLSAAEIYAQFILLDNLAQQKFGKPLTNVVIMGMGEPLLNYEQVMMFCNILSSEEGRLFSSQRITMSTVGLPKMIKKLADDQAKFKLAISLHAPFDDKRKAIIPLSNTYTIEELLQMLDYYYKKTKKLVTFEYVMLKDFNDSIEDAKRMTGICKRIPSKVNIIQFNAYEGSDFQKSDDAVVQNFINVLEANRINVRLRKSRGDSINAACGQLANNGE